MLKDIFSSFFWTGLQVVHLILYIWLTNMDYVAYFMPILVWIMTICVLPMDIYRFILARQIRRLKTEIEELTTTGYAPRYTVVRC